MSGRPKVADVLLAEDRDRAQAIGATVYVNSKRYKALREAHFFTAIDGAVAGMQAAKFTNPYDGRVLGALTAVLVRNDPKALGVMRKRKVAALDGSNQQRDELFTLCGQLIAEDYLTARKDNIPRESRLSFPRGLLGRLDGLFEEMRAAGQAMAQEDVLDRELAVILDDLPDATNLARGIIEEVVGSYESLVPEIEGDDEIPEGVQRHALAKAAFLRLGVDDLAELAASEGYEDLPSKESMAEVLSEKYSDELDRVAEIVLGREQGDPDYGLVTRLVPLVEPPDIEAAQLAFQALRGHYVEHRVALFFAFGNVERPNPDLLRIVGRIRSFSVNPAEAGGETRLNARPRTAEITITLRRNQAWGEVDARRAGDLNVVRRVLRRSDEVLPADEVARPDAVTRKPYDDWDPRTLWMLDFLRRDLQAENLRLDDTLMANFVSAGEGPGDGSEPPDRRRPNVESVRLRGRQLHEHPEACARIASTAHLRDMEIRVRKAIDPAQGTSKLVRFRLSWEGDHLAVFSGADEHSIDADLHSEIVRLVRLAAERALDEDSLTFMLRQIERRAAGGSIAEGAQSVLDAPHEQGGTA
jgi:hypothetical protein